MKSLTQKELKKILHYDPQTGVFTWKISNSNRAPIGSIAGCTKESRPGYKRIVIRIKNIEYKAHRLAFLYMIGSMPPLVDHKDLNTLNNKWSNLRKATRSQNGANRNKQKNNNSGYKGIFFNKKCSLNPWTATIMVNKK